MTITSPTPPRPVRDQTAEGAPTRPRRRRRRMRTGDKVVVGFMVAIPTLFVILLIWLPALASVVLGFARWEGIGGLRTIQWIGLTNYQNIFTIYPPFWPALQHNVIWLVYLFGASAFGMFLAVLLDKEIRGTRLYQTAIYLPVVLSLALTGFIWQLLYSTDQGLINAVTGLQIDWYGDPRYNLWAVLVATGWQHTGYIMLLYLAGLKSVDPVLREAAAVDGASEVKTFFSVIFPVMRPINLIILVVTVINSLRAFDIVWIVNKGRNGLEIIGALVYQNIVGEASRIGFGSALATIMLVISSVFVILYLNVVMREDR